MGNLNTVTMSGNLVADPDWKPQYGKDGVCGITIAVNGRKKEGDEWVEVANFFDWAIWGGLGKWYAENHKKGDLIVLTGRAQQRKWVDEASGENRYAINFVATDAELSAGRGRKSERSSTPAQQQDPDDVSFDAPTPPRQERTEDLEIPF